jgi:N-acetylated-alpha-linked acidic dipeptidase
MTREEIEDHNRMLRERTMELAADPTKPFVAPRAQEPAPHLEFAPLRNALERLQKAAAAYDRGSAHDDRIAMRLERALTLDQGLPGRPWYRHYVYAPGAYTGYGVKTFPAVREAIELKKWSEANAQIGVLANVINGYASLLERK